MRIVVRLKAREYWWKFRLKLGTMLLNAAYKVYPPLNTGGFQSIRGRWYKR